MGQSWASAQLEIAQACLPTDRRAPSPSALRQVFESRMARLFAQTATRAHRQQLPSDARLVDEVSFFTGHADALSLMTQPLGPAQHAFPHYAFQLLLSEPSPDSWTAIEALFHLGVDARALGLGFEQALSAQPSALNTTFWARNQAFVDARAVTEALEDVGTAPARRRLRL